MMDDREQYGRSPLMDTLPMFRALEKLRDEDPEAYARALAAFVDYYWRLTN